jgi:hypothetical protein
MSGGVKLDVRGRHDIGPNLAPPYADLLRIIYTFHLYLQMLIMWAGIAGAVAEVAPDTLRPMWEEVHYRWDILSRYIWKLRTSNCNSHTFDKTWCVGLHLYVRI